MKVSTPAFAVGLKIEIALVRWETGDRTGAISELAEVLDAVEHIDPAGWGKMNVRINLHEPP